MLKEQKKKLKNQNLKNSWIKKKSDLIYLKFKTDNYFKKNAQKSSAVIFFLEDIEKIINTKKMTIYNWIK